MIAQVSADILHDDVLFEIFDWYLFQSEEECDDYGQNVEAWQTLASVCQRWRAIIFRSPRGLNLRLFFTNGSSVETLAAFPSLPIIIMKSDDETRGLDDIIEAFDYSDRVCEISLLGIPSPRLEEALAAMGRPFPALTFLELEVPWQGDETDETTVVDPDSFLGGSAPHLQHLYFYHVPFPRLPGFLLSATDLVHLDLWNIPRIGYFSPEAMVDCLSALTKLNTLCLGFVSSQLRLYQDSLRTPQIVLPLLKQLRFKGDSGYLENLVAPIYTPTLDRLEISFFPNLVFDTPELLRFVRHTPNVKAPVEAHVNSSDGCIWVKFTDALPTRLVLKILCRGADSQLSSLAQVFRSSYPRILIPTVERLHIDDTAGLENGTVNDQWLEVLRPFTLVKDLHLSWRFVPRIADALATEVLPALENIYSEMCHPPGASQETREQHVAVRQFANQTKTVSIRLTRWEQASVVDGLP